MTPAGAKIYVYTYRVGGREATKRRYTIGRHGSPWTPTTARWRAEQLALLVAQGVDPMTVERDRRDEAATLAFDGYAERFIRDYLTRRWPGSWDTYAALLRNKAVPAFAGKTIKTITRAHVAALLATMQDRVGARRNMYAVLRRLFRWAVGQGDLEQSPIREMEAPPAPASRDRVLTDAELGAVWRASAALGFPFQYAFRLLITTGQRREEVAGIGWHELDQGEALWTLPGARAKNKQTTLVPLNAMAVEAIEEVARFLEGCEVGPVRWPRRVLVLTTTHGRSAISGYSKAKLRLDSRIANSDGEPIAHWRVHDLRRTLATGLQRLDVRFEVTEAVLNHTSGAKAGVAGIYQRHDWKVEKRAALSAWGSLLTAAINNRQQA